MRLHTKYDFDSLTATVSEIGHSLYVVEFYKSGQLVNKSTFSSLEQAQMIAENYTGNSGGNKQLLNEGS